MLKCEHSLCTASYPGIGANTVQTEQAMQHERHGAGLRQRQQMNVRASVGQEVCSTGAFLHTRELRTEKTGGCHRAIFPIWR